MKKLLVIALVSLISSTAFSAECSNSNKEAVKKEWLKKYGKKAGPYVISSCSKTNTRIAARGSADTIVSPSGAHEPCFRQYAYVWSLANGAGTVRTSQGEEICPMASN